MWTRAWRRLAPCSSCPTTTPDGAGASRRWPPSDPSPQRLPRQPVRPLREKSASHPQLDVDIYLYTYVYTYIAVRMFCMSPCLKGPWSLCGSKATNSWITLSHELQPPAPKQNVVYTQCFMLQAFCFCLFFGSQGPLYYTGHRRKHFQQNNSFGLFWGYLFLGFITDEITEASTHHHVS